MHYNKHTNIWVVSDTHFNHSNILTFKDQKGNPVRPEFSSTSAMNERMIYEWNSRVKPGDKVYHLGDVFFGSKDEFKSMWPRLAGSKRLVVGNHDDIEFLSSGSFFKKVYMWRVLKDFQMILSHVPLHTESLVRGSIDGTPMLNVHGHIHEKKSPKGPYHCVCVEQTNYAPVHIENLHAIAKRHY